MTLIRHRDFHYSRSVWKHVLGLPSSRAAHVRHQMIQTHRQITTLKRLHATPSSFLLLTKQYFSTAACLPLLNAHNYIHRWGIKGLQGRVLPLACTLIGSVTTITTSYNSVENCSIFPSQNALPPLLASLKNVALSSRTAVLWKDLPCPSHF